MTAEEPRREYAMRWCFPTDEGMRVTQDNQVIRRYPGVAGGEDHYETFDDALSALRQLLSEHGPAMRVEFEALPAGYVSEQAEKREYQRLKGKYEAEAPVQETWQAPPSTMPGERWASAPARWLRTIGWPPPWTR